MIEHLYELQINGDVTLSPQMNSILRADSALAETQGLLTDAQLQLIYEQRWLQVFVPHRYGGLASPLPAGVRLEEAIAFANGSAGWVVTLCAGANMFAGYFEPALAQQVFTGPATCLAGSGQATGFATEVRNGFIINGRWPYASGAPYATHFTANCKLISDGSVKSFIFTRDEVTIEEDWNFVGLNATAGHSFTVRNCFVSSQRMFEIAVSSASPEDIINRYPFLQFAQATLTANMSGMCRHFLDLAGDIIMSGPNHQSKGDRAVKALTDATTKFFALRSRFYEVLDESWETHLRNERIGFAGSGLLPAESHHYEQVFTTLSATASALARQGRQLINNLYPHCGMQAAKPHTPINQVWRDINTASQHTLLC